MLPYLTSEFPGIGGVIKQRAEDFFVQEIPLYDPSGEGEHVYCEVEKSGVTTFDAIARMAAALNVSSRNIGYAGMKDARAITRQIFSIQGTTPEKVMHLQLPGMAIQWASFHGNKLRLGHLAGNRFAIKIREVAATDVVKLHPVLEILQRRGMPNYFGEQRFGRRNNNDLLGAALVRGDHEALLKLLLGSPNPSIDDRKTVQARTAFDRRDNSEAMRLWPRSGGLERRVLARLMKTHRPSAAVHAIDEKLRRLWVSALQSRVFNDVLAARLATPASIDHLLDGDMATKHDNGACFHVETAAAEQARCDAFEISPTGPLIGYRMSFPQGVPLEMEQSVLSAVNLEPSVFHQSGKLRVKGARRALRVRPGNVTAEGGSDQFGPYITTAFNLPAGTFATTLLREIMKTEEAEATAQESNGDDAVDASDEELNDSGVPQTEEMPEGDGVE